MMPEKNIGTTKTINKTQKENQWLWRALFATVALCVIGMFLVINKYEEKYNLGVAVLNADVCVEFEQGYTCNTPNSVEFIEKK